MLNDKILSSKNTFFFKTKIWSVGQWGPERGFYHKNSSHIFFFSMISCWKSFLTFRFSKKYPKSKCLQKRKPSRANICTSLSRARGMDGWCCSTIRCITTGKVEKQLSQGSNQDHLHSVINKSTSDYVRFFFTQLSHI